MTGPLNGKVPNLDPPPKPEQKLAQASLPPGTGLFLSDHTIRAITDALWACECDLNNQGNDMRLPEVVRMSARITRGHLKHARLEFNKAAGLNEGD